MALAAAAALAGLLLQSLWSGSRSSAAARPGVAPQIVLPAPVKPAFTVATPRPLDGRRPLPMWAPVLRDVVARVAPDTTARPITRLLRATPEETQNIVLILARAEDEDGRPWVQVRLPILPNNSTGWIPRSSLGGPVPVDTRLVVDVEGLTATLLERGRVVFRAPIGIGKDAWPTPRGSFYVRSRVTSYRNPFYGPIAFGTSARSAVLTDWPAGGFVGIHGTNRPDLIPGRVSHGCIRLRNDDILRLARLMPVGTPVEIG